MKKTILSFITFIGLSAAAQAATLEPGGPHCLVSNLTIGGMNASACEGAFSGNDSNEDLDGIFGQTGWTEIVKVDAPATSNTGNSVTLMASPAGGTSGTWSVNTWSSFTTVMAVLKGGPTFSAYLIDISNGLGGTWNTNGILKGNGNPGPGLSHMTLYYTGTIAPVPLPAAGVLLVGALGGLGLMRRRKKS